MSFEVNQPLVHKYRNMVRGYLDRQTEQLVTELRAIAQAEPAPQTFLLQFEVEMQDFTRGFPVYWFAMHKNAAPLESTPPRSLLQSISFTVPEEAAADEEYNQIDEDKSELDYDTLIAWFAECWRAAEGLNYPYPAYISHHDSIYSLDLRTLIEVQDDKKWDGAGG